MSRSDYYKLGLDHEVLPASLDDFAEMYKGSQDGRRVDFDQIGEVEVSTVFLGIDHNWGGGTPILFETMIFGGPHNEWQVRYHTWDEALAGHNRVVTALREGVAP